MRHPRYLYVTPFLPPHFVATAISLLLFVFWTLSIAQAQWTEEAPILQASDEVDDAQFGLSVAIQGNLALVGASGHASGGITRGQVYSQRHNGTMWVEEQILQASDEVNQASFGFPVAVSGSVAVTGAYFHPSGGTGRGQAYIFRHNGVTWTEEQILQASDEVNNARFGVSADVDGNVVVVGAVAHPSGGVDRGQAYVYRHNGTTWIQEQILQASDEVNSAFFGLVSINGNVILVSASRHPSGGSDRGQVYVYRYNGAVWAEEQILQASDEEDDCRFGSALDLNGNVAVVGAYFHSSGGTTRGQAYLYQFTGSTWQQTQILQASDEQNASGFGISVSVEGSVVAVGAWSHPSGGTGRGQAYMWRKIGATWQEEQILAASDEVNGAGFGRAVSVSGNSVVVGANFHPSGGISRRGQAYTFTHPTPNSSVTWDKFE